METIIRHVRDLGSTERSAIEQVVGHTLCENQQLVIQVVNLDLRPVGDLASGTLPDWCKVYEGLSEGEVAELENVVLQRADLGRASE